MTPEFVTQIVRDMFMTAFWLSAPLLAVGFCVGIVISLIQIVTSIQDSAFNAIPRLVAFLLASLFTMPWMLRHMTTYTTDILGNLSRYAR
jgi:flagellar biosynthetic protein FliQ